MNLNFSQYIGHKGEDNPSAKITTNQAQDICILLSTTDWSYERIARKVKTTYSIVRQIKRRRTWTHISNYYPLRQNKKPSISNKINFLF